MFKKPTFTQFYAIFSLINVQKYFAWLSFRSFPAGMPIFSQIRVGHVTWKGDSLMHPLLKHFLRQVIILLKLINQRIHRKLSHLKMAIFEVYCEGVVWGPTKEETLKPQILLLLTKQISWCGGLLPSSVSSALARKTLHSTHHFWQQQQQTEEWTDYLS